MMINRICLSFDFQVKGELQKIKQLSNIIYIHNIATNFLYENRFFEV